MHKFMLIEGSFEVKLPTIWTDENRGGKSQRRERVRRKKMQVRKKVEKSRNTMFFQCFVALEGRKVGSSDHFWALRCQMFQMFFVGSM
jgi:hypothetical protein